MIIKNFQRMTLFVLGNALLLAACADSIYNRYPASINMQMVAKVDRSKEIIRSVLRTHGFTVGEDTSNFGVVRLTADKGDIHLKISAEPVKVGMFDTKDIVALSIVQYVRTNDALNPYISVDVSADVRSMGEEITRNLPI